MCIVCSLTQLDFEQQLYLWALWWQQKSINFCVLLSVCSYSYHAHFSKNKVCQGEKAPDNANFTACVFFLQGIAPSLFCFYCPLTFRWLNLCICLDGIDVISRQVDLMRSYSVSWESRWTAFTFILILNTIGIFKDQIIVVPRPSKTIIWNYYSYDLATTFQINDDSVSAWEIK